MKTLSDWRLKHDWYPILTQNEILSKNVFICIDIGYYSYQFLHYIAIHIYHPFHNHCQFCIFHWPYIFDCIDTFCNKKLGYKTLNEND